MKRSAIIDLGTNTFNLLIIEFTDSGYHILYKNKIPVKLGEGGIEKGILTSLAIERGMSALKEHLNTIAEFQCKNVHAFATSGIRSAKNGTAFTAQAKKELNLDIKIISGHKEAELIYFGVREALTIGEKSLIIDIGGGSTEFIIADDKKIFWKESFQLGAARLLEKFQPSDPINLSQIYSLHDHFHNKLKPLKEAVFDHPINCMIGSSGSFDTFADLLAHQYGKPDLLMGRSTYDFELKDYLELHQLLLKSNKSTRSKMPGMLLMRVDMIVIASILTEWTISNLEINQLRLSTYSLKEGVIKTLKDHSGK